mmetsp:Transcript_37422/g.120929  ORF Transcript_37422/g.120929 Transcript_37422/m.120929 type:complete len:409 (-) Transcript_37422:568-1794(-)
MATAPAHAACSESTAPRARSLSGPSCRRPRSSARSFGSDSGFQRMQANFSSSCTAAGGHHLCSRAATAGHSRLRMIAPHDSHKRGVLHRSRPPGAPAARELVELELQLRALGGLGGRAGEVKECTLQRRVRERERWVGGETKGDQSLVRHAEQLRLDDGAGATLVGGARRGDDVKIGDELRGEAGGAVLWRGGRPHVGDAEREALERCDGRVEREVVAEREPPAGVKPQKMAARVDHEGSGRLWRASGGGGLLVPDGREGELDGAVPAEDGAEALVGALGVQQVGLRLEQQRGAVAPVEAGAGDEPLVGAGRQRRQQDTLRREQILHQQRVVRRVRLREHAQRVLEVLVVLLGGKPLKKGARRRAPLRHGVEHLGHQPGLPRPARGELGVGRAAFAQRGEGDDALHPR